MKRRSLRTRIIMLTTLGILICAMFIGGTGIYSFKQGMDESCEDILSLTCSKSAHELDMVFEQIEQSVNTLGRYTLDNLESLERLAEDAEYRDAYMDHLDALALTLANETDGAVGVYVRFNPKLVATLSGFFRVRLTRSSGFLPVQLTDLALYDEDDIPHVGWWHIPVKAGHPVWMEPYQNDNIKKLITSYVMPLYMEGTLVGVVGMDIEFSHITEVIDSIRLYETGHAFLTDSELHVIYSEHLPVGEPVEVLVDSAVEEYNDSEEKVYEHTHNGVKRRLVIREMDNEMCLAVTVPLHEINQATDELTERVVVLAMLIAMVFILATVAIVERIIRPLQQLNTAAQEIAAGNLDISVNCDTGDEVETLAESLGETARQLKIRIDYINSLAFEDKLTGVRNNTAYLQETAELKQEILKGGCAFAVFVIDVNGLKQINDTLGHASGNELIIKAARATTAVFGEKNTFRIGGDEFAAICRNMDAAVCEEKKEAFMDEARKDDDGIHLAAAIGGAIYDPAQDSCYESVFERADGEMYLKKQEMKRRGESSYF